MMTKDEKIKTILTELLNTEDYVTVAHLASISDYSVRTVYTLLQSETFVKFLHGATLQKQQNKGIKLIANDRQKYSIYSELNLNTSNSVKDINETQKILLLLLSSKDAITLDKLAIELFRSKASITSILQDVEKYIQKYNCILSKKTNYGISLYGKEEDIRELFYNLVQKLPVTCSPNFEFNPRISSQLLQQMNPIFSKQIIEPVIEIVQASEVNLSTHFCDYDFGILVLRFSILIYRNTLNYKLREFNLLNQNIQEYYVSAMVKALIETKFHLTLDRNEIFYIEKALLSTRKQINQITNQILDDTIIDYFINSISNRLNVDFSHDQQLKANLINHIKPAIRRIKYGISSNNPLLEQIKEKYTEVYVAIITTIDQIEENEHIYFDSNEIGFICLHIVSALNRAKRLQSIKTILICDSGITFEAYLKSSVEAMFNEIEIVKICSYVNYQQDKEDYHLILNASSYQINKPNCIVIDELFSQESSSKIRHWIFAKELNETMTLRELFNNYLFYFKDNCKSVDELLTKYCLFLTDNDYVTPNFLDSVKKRMKYAATTIGRGVAVPHGSKKYVKKSIILIIKLDKPIIWDNQSIDLIFFAAIGNDVSSEYSKIFRKLAKIVSDDKKTYILKNCKDLEEIKNLLFEV